MVAEDRPDFANFIVEHQAYNHNSEYLKLNGSNANQDIDIGVYSLTVTGLTSSDDIVLKAGKKLILDGA